MMWKGRSLKVKSIAVAVILGLLISLITGLLPNESEMSIPEITRYGYPFVWLVTNLNGPTDYIISNLALDVVFWVAISIIASLVLTRVIMKWEIPVTYRTLILPFVLLIPFGLVMCFIHELGHGLWGTLAGGRLLYIHIAYVIIYPFGVRFSPHFQLGTAAVDGLTYGSFGYGLMLLGGSMTTSIAAWIVAGVLQKARLSSRSQVALKVFGLWGILDLPFYVVFPQMGLGHWIFFGGRGPEPLIGARMMGMPDLAFYVAVVISTVGLVVLYFKSLCEKAVKQVTIIRERCGTQKTQSVLLGAVLCGVLISLVTGIVWHPPNASIIGATYYGHPLVWRVILSTITSTTKYYFINFVIDALFWMIVSFGAWIVVEKIVTAP